MDNLVRLSCNTRLPLSELIEWEPESIASALRWMEDKANAEREAAKG